MDTALLDYANLASRVAIASEEPHRSIFNSRRDNSIPLAKMDGTNCSPSSIFALLIGINEYNHFPPLTGAVSDATVFRDFLAKQCPVPQSHLHLLVNQDATRKGILDSIRTVVTDPRIQPEDTLFIFFAGYGAYARCPSMSQHGSDPHTPIIIPHDFSPGLDIGENTPGIAVSTLPSLLRGCGTRNINVILDCSFHFSDPSGSSASRWVPKVRSVGLQSASAAIADAATPLPNKGTRSVQQPPVQDPFILCACGPRETAKEQYGRGKFTRALLALLRITPMHLLQCHDLITRIDPLVGQTPTFLGGDSKRYLLSNEQNSRFTRHFDALSTTETHQYTLTAGLAHGITNGTQFELTPSEIPGFPTPAKAVVVHTGAFLSVLELSALTPVSTLPKSWKQHERTVSFVATQTGLGNPYDVRLFIPQHPDYLPVFEAVVSVMNCASSPGIAQTGRERDSQRRNILLVEHPHDAHVEVSMPSDGASQWHFIYRDDRVVSTRFDRPVVVCETQDSEDLVKAIRSLVHFYGELNRHTSVVFDYSTGSSSGSVDVECYELHQPDTSVAPQAVSRSSLRRSRANRVPRGPNLFREGHLDVVLSDAELEPGGPSTTYGLKLANHGPVDLFPHLFYFDNTEISIGDYHPALKACRIPPAIIPLTKQGGALTIGYGPGGTTRGLQFTIPTGQCIDSGLLKILFLTRPLNLATTSKITQTPYIPSPPSSFQTAYRRGTPVPTEDTSEQTTIKSGDIAFGMLFSLVQRTPDAERVLGNDDIPDLYEKYLSSLPIPPPTILEGLDHVVLSEIEAPKSWRPKYPTRNSAEPPHTIRQWATRVRKEVLERVRRRKTKKASKSKA